MEQQSSLNFHKEPLMQTKKPNIEYINEHKIDNKRNKEDYSRQDSILSKTSTDTNGLLKIPSIDSRDSFYPTVETEHRGTSAPVFYTVKTATRPPTSTNKDKQTVKEMLVEFRKKVETDKEGLKTGGIINLTEKQFKAFEYPKETDRSKVIFGILEKQRLARENKKLQEKLEWELKRKKMREKLRREKMS